MKSSTVYKFILALLVLSAAVYGLFYLRSVIEDKVAEVQVYRSKEARNKNLEFGNSLRQNMSTVLEQEALIKNAFISSTGMVGFIQALEDSARLYGLKITINSVEEGDAQPLGGVSGKTSPVTFNIQLEGSYVQTRQFLGQLAEFEKLLSISNVSVFKSSQDMYTTRVAVAGIMLSYE